MATRGRPKGEETTMIHVRIPVTLHAQLEIIQFVTQRTTTDVVKDMLQRYVLTHSDLLSAVAKTRNEANRVLTKAEAEAWERQQLEDAEGAAKPENRYASREEWENN